VLPLFLSENGFYTKFPPPMWVIRTYTISQLRFKPNCPEMYQPKPHLKNRDLGRGHPGLYYNVFVIRWFTAAINKLCAWIFSVLCIQPAYPHNDSLSFNPSSWNEGNGSFFILYELINFSTTLSTALGSVQDRGQWPWPCSCWIFNKSWMALNHRSDGCQTTIKQR